MPSEKEEKKRKPGAKKGTRHYELHPHERQLESLFRFADETNRLLLEGKKAQKKLPKPPKPLKTKSGTPDGRSPIIKSVIKNQYAKTGGMHPRLRRVVKQAQELNKGSHIKKIDVTPTKITSPPKFIKEDKVETFKQILSEYSTKAYATSSSRWSSRHGRTRGAQPGNKPERLIVKAAKHANKDAKLLAQQKITKLRAKSDYAQAKAERDAELKQLSRIT